MKIYRIEGTGENRKEVEVLSEEMLRRCQQSISSKHQDVWIRDSTEQLHLGNNDNKAQISVVSDEKAAPSLLASDIGQEFVLHCDQRLYERYDPKAGLRVKSYEGLMVHKEIDEGSFITLDTLQQGEMVSYLPIINVLLKSFNITRGANLNTSWEMVFEEK